jgi:hypothetical protein
LLTPIVLVAPDAITVAIGVRKRPDVQDCQGNPEIRVTVDLGEPLGARHLLDGSAFPAIERR